MEHKVHFVVAAFGKDVDDFVLHIYASLAEQERKLIAERCRAAAAVLKQKGAKFGFARSKALQRRIHVLALPAQQRATIQRCEAYRAHIEWAVR
jgi:DNA invertase Pin-like site-specific DNA recombinase